MRRHTLDTADIVKGAISRPQFFLYWPQLHGVSLVRTTSDRNDRVDERENLRIPLAVLGVVSTAIGIRWLQLFIFTGYRAHLRYFMIPLGVLATVIGASMLYLSLLIKSKK